MEDITDADCAHRKRVCKDFERKISENIMICIFKVIHYFKLMCLRTLEICDLKYTNLILQNFLQLQNLHVKQLLKRPN